MSIKVKVAKGTRVLYRLQYGDTDAVTAQRAICYVNCVHESSVYANATGEEGGGISATLYLRDEGKTWVRGWTGKTATRFKRAVLTEDRKRKLAKAKEAQRRDEERAANTIAWLRGAADIVRRAKVPRDLRRTAFMAALSPYGGIMR